mmetsp:Transcript_5062/g.13613  ORF Transcript_5062/g.13613 Transcript_5062/m.13613 type:complete len:239 (-) Transcript_5062:613-1329(-)
MISSTSLSTCGYGPSRMSRETRSISIPLTKFPSNCSNTPDGSSVVDGTVSSRLGSRSHTAVSFFVLSCAYLYTTGPTPEPSTGNVSSQQRARLPVRVRRSCPRPMGAGRFQSPNAGREPMTPSRKPSGSGWNMTTRTIVASHAWYSSTSDASAPASSSAAAASRSSSRLVRASYLAFVAECSLPMRYLNSIGSLMRLARRGSCTLPVQRSSGPRDNRNARSRFQLPNAACDPHTYKAS